MAREDSEQEQAERPPGRRLRPLQLIASVLAAAFGVQSSKNRERDFRQGHPGIFIAAGIIFTLLFIGAVVAVVKLVLEGAAP